MSASRHPRQYSDSTDEFDDDDDNHQQDASRQVARHHQQPPQPPPPPRRPTDRIRRSFHQTTQDNSFDYLSGRRQDSLHGHPNPNLNQQQPETIRVTLDEGYFAKERRALLAGLANLRQKCASMQLFNPAKNDQNVKRQEEWTEKEKYTLDSLNEFRANSAGHDEAACKFQWNKPPDGREVWPNKMQYFLAITSYSVGLGNVIRFPILVQKNGGLAFILPFLVMLVLEGIPLLYLELAIGQRMRMASICCWNLVSPLALGIGLASASVSFVIGLYYNTIVGWTLLYLYRLTSLPSSSSSSSNAGQSTLPFVQCPVVDSNKLQVAAAAANSSGEQQVAAECLAGGPYEFYWFRRTLNVGASVNEWAPFNWPVFVCLISAWLISYCCLMRGLSTSKRIVYIISLLPYVILAVFLFKSLSLPGSQAGLAYFVEPQWDKLVDPFVWLQAAGQVFFSLGLGFGGLIALSSYNPVNNNCHRDAVRVALVNFGLSMLAGLVIFASLGFRAQLAHSKCLAERERHIDFYLADYNLKVLDYGSVFAQVPLSAQVASHGDENQGQDARDKKQTTPIEFEARPGGAREDRRKWSRSIKQQEDEEEEEEEEDNRPGELDEEYDSQDAIASINNLDRQLDLGSPANSFDYGDSDIEFVINASNLISRQQLDEIIRNIPHLPECSLERELDQSTQANGLVFVVMAEALAQFHKAGQIAKDNHNNNNNDVDDDDDDDKFWVILFYLMILTLGFDSQFGNLEGLLSSLMDLRWISRRFSRHLMTAIICSLSLVLSTLLFSHAAGSYLFALFDEYAASVSLVLIALFELLAISYVYGLKKFRDECELMTGRRPHLLVLVSWRYLSPVLLLVVLAASLRQQFGQELTYDIWAPIRSSQVAAAVDDGANTTKLKDSNTITRGSFIVESWPSWCIAFGSLLIGCCVVWIPLVAVARILFNVQLIAEPSRHANHQDDEDDDDHHHHHYEDEEHTHYQKKAHYFPAEELREYHSLHEEAEQRRPSRWERLLFGFTDDD